MCERIILEEQRDESLGVEPLSRLGAFELGSDSHTPCPFPRAGQPAGRLRGEAHLTEEPADGPAPLALLETIAAKLAPNPFVQALEFKPTSRVAVVGKPSDQEQIKFDDHLRQTDAPVPTGDLPDFLLG